MGGGGSHIHRHLIIRVKATRPSLTQREMTEVQTVKREGLSQTALALEVRQSPRRRASTRRGSSGAPQPRRSPVEGRVRPDRSPRFFNQQRIKNESRSKFSRSNSDPSPYHPLVRRDPPQLMQLATLVASVATLSQSTAERSTRNA